MKKRRTKFWNKHEAESFAERVGGVMKDFTEVKGVKCRYIVIYNYSK